MDGSRRRWPDHWSTNVKQVLASLVPSIVFKCFTSNNLKMDTTSNILGVAHELYHKYPLTLWHNKFCHKFSTKGASILEPSAS